MKILIVQNKVFEKVEDTIDNIEKILSKTNLENLDFIVFGEMFTTPYDISLFKDYQQKNEESLVLKFLKDLSIKTKAYVVGGTVVENSDNKLYNTSYVFNRVGEVIKKYRKQKLFSIIYPDGSEFSENKVLTPGVKAGIFDTEYGKMGIMICFDIRFPLLATELMKSGAKVIFVPAAFNDFTGPLHWQTCFKARAIDNQLFLVGASPSADSFGDYKTYGHSLVVDPLGKILGELSKKSDFLEIDINLDDIDHARSILPIIRNY